MDLNSWDAIATMIGAIVGAGILGLPYVFAKAGVLPATILLVVLSAVILVLHLMLGEVVLRTNGDHQLTGYARRYAGTIAGRFMMLSMLIGVYGAIIAYIIGMGGSLNAIFGGSQTTWMVLVFIVMGLLLAQRLLFIEASERYLSGAKVFLIILVSLIAFVSSHYSPSNLTPTLSWTLPFGVILFSLLGTAAIPEVREELKGDFKKLRGVLIWSSVIVLCVNAVFALAVVGVTGASTSEIAIQALGQSLGNGAVILLNIFALLAMASAFLALGEALKKTFEEDYGWRPFNAWIATISVPAVLVFLGLRSFIDVIGVSGAFAAGIDGIVIVLMYRSALKKGDRKPEYSANIPVAVQLIVLAVFVLALVWAVADVLSLLPRIS